MVMFELCATKYNGRRLSAKQKELIIQFAETERQSSDTKVNGVTDKGENMEFDHFLYNSYQKVRETRAQERNEAFSEK